MKTLCVSLQRRDGREENHDYAIKLLTETRSAALTLGYTPSSSRIERTEI